MSSKPVLSLQMVNKFPLANEFSRCTAVSLHHFIFFIIGTSNPKLRPEALTWKCRNERLSFSNLVRAFHWWSAFVCCWVCLLGMSTVKAQGVSIACSWVNVPSFSTEANAIVITSRSFVWAEISVVDLIWFLTGREQLSDKLFKLSWNKQMRPYAICVRFVTFYVVLCAVWGNTSGKKWANV